MQSIGNSAFISNKAYLERNKKKTHDADITKVYFLR